jgi:pimeloyl-ACP methyl ester carboxylesterase
VALAAHPVRRSFSARDGARLSYLVWGAKDLPAVLCLHGGMACAMDWWQLGERLASANRVVALDQRGCGESVWDDDARYGIEPIVDDVVALAERVDLREAVVIGHSLGAAAACLLAVRQPELVRALVLEDGGPRDTTPQPRVFAEPIPPSFASREAALEYLADTGAAGRGRAPWVLETRFVQRDDGSLSWRADVEGAARWAAAGGEPLVLMLWDLVPRIACPTLVVRGAESTVFPPDVPTRMAGLNDLVETVEIAGAGHGVHYEQPDAFAASVERFLAAL